MLQGQFAEFLQLHSSITLVYSTYSLVSDLIQSTFFVKKTKKHILKLIKSS